MDSTSTMDSTQIRKLMEDQLKLSRRLQARVRELERANHAPLAVVGMGLRLPSELTSPDEYWDFLRGEGSAVSAIPTDRPGLRDVHDPKPGRPGHSYVDKAAFLADIANFDADFFGISGREADLLDPQQRMLLETAWEALERAGIAVRRTDRLKVGVYLGMMASEYGERLAVRPDKTPIDPYYATGGGLCFGAGRISHVMGFSGPVVSVDTACSSSLVALHLAVRGLRSSECRYALVCGSNLLLSANLMVSLCQSRALAPDGRSKSFLASADGYGRGEGVGVLVLMRLDEAEREGRPILAVVRGTAVNHDGAASGLTVPNGPAQQEVIGAALADAGVDAAELGWIEAHGTGTLLGDPIEVGALDGAIGATIRQRGTPLALGSVKSRLGHLEAASGVAGLIKTVLMLQHGEIPAAAGADDELNSHIHWDRLNFTVPRHNQPWPEALSRRVAGVNSFGMSGTNAHAVLEAYPGTPPPVAAATGRPELLTLSARDPGALADLVDSVAAYLRKADPGSIPSVCHTLRVGRASFGHRLAVTGTTGAELAEQLTAGLDTLRRRAADPVSASRVRSVTLRVAPDLPPLAELTEAFPLLGAAGEERPEDPAESLASLLGQIIPRVRLRVDPKLAGGAARLDWATEAGAESRPLTGERPGPVGLLLDALARLYAAGAELRLDPLRHAGARLLADLPTYPFQRRRYWIEELRGTVDGGPADSGADPRTRGEAAPSAQDRVSVEAYLVAELRELLRTSGELDQTRSFLEAGGDSFISTLYMTKIEERFEVGLSPEDLPIELPLHVLIGRLADDITGTAGADRQEQGA